MADQQITINARKYDRVIRRTWICDLIERIGPLIVLVGEFDRDVEHAGLGSIRRGTVSHEYYWLDRWYNVFRFDEPDGSFRNYYCNVTVPPSFENNVLDYVDLDVDIVVWKDLTYEVVDQDDFERNKVKYGYPQSFSALAEKSVADMIRMIECREFPFDKN